MSLHIVQNLNGPMETLLSSRISSIVEVKLKRFTSKGLSMLSKMLMLLLCLSTSSFVYAAKTGAGSGGGGGGICVNGSCMTLAEAGIRISADTNKNGQWFITPNVIAELEKVKTTLPFGKTGIDRISIGKLDTFYKVESVSRKLLKQVKNDYRDILEETNNSAMADDLEIFAISTDKTTYLLPSFFKLNDRQKALTLIHEGIVRNFNQDYRLALQFDGDYLDYVSRKKEQNYSPLKFLRVLSKVSSDSVSQTPMVFDYIESKLGRSLSISDMTDFSQIQVGTKLKLLAYKNLLRNQAVVSEYMDVFAEASITELEDYSDSVKNSFSHDELVNACQAPLYEATARLPGKGGNIFIHCNTLNIDRVLAVRIVFKDLNQGTQSN